MLLGRIQRPEIPLGDDRILVLEYHGIGGLGGSGGSGGAARGDHVNDGVGGNGGFGGSGNGGALINSGVSILVNNTIVSNAGTGGTLDLVAMEGTRQVATPPVETVVLAAMPWAASVIQTAARI